MSILKVTIINLKIGKQMNGKVSKFLTKMLPNHLELTLNILEILDSKFLLYQKNSSSINK